MYYAQTYAESANIGTLDVQLDGYARRGVTVSRDAASLIVAALHRDAFSMRERGGSANLDGAAANEALANSIGKALR